MYYALFAWHCVAPTRVMPGPKDRSYASNATASAVAKTSLGVTQRHKSYYASPVVLQSARRDAPRAQLSAYLAGTVPRQNAVSRFRIWLCRGAAECASRRNQAHLSAYPARTVPVRATSKSGVAVLNTMTVILKIKMPSSRIDSCRFIVSFVPQL